MRYTDSVVAGVEGHAGDRSTLDWAAQEAVARDTRAPGRRS